MSTSIHPSAVVEKGARIGDGSTIGPLCYVGPKVTIGRDNILHSHVVLDGVLEIGDGNEFFSFACLGKKCQDLKFKEGAVAGATIGSHNVFREYCTVNAASKDGAFTRIGDHNLFLSYSHVAHDCQIGHHVILSTDSKLAGHVHVHDHASINAKTGVIQFATIGRFAFVGGFNKVVKDILPFSIADGRPSRIRAINKIGLERNGFSPEKIKVIREAFRILIRSELTVEEAVRRLETTYPDVPEVQEMVRFARESRLGLARPHGSKAQDD